MTVSHASLFLVIHTYLVFFSHSSLHRLCSPGYIVSFPRTPFIDRVAHLNLFADSLLFLFSANRNNFILPYKSKVRRSLMFYKSSWSQKF